MRCTRCTHVAHGGTPRAQAGRYTHTHTPHTMDVEYLKQDVAAALEEGLATVVKYQPDDQVEFLGQYLLKYVSNQRSEAQVRCV